MARGRRRRNRQAAVAIAVLASLVPAACLDARWGKTNPESGSAVRVPAIEGAATSSVPSVLLAMSAARAGDVAPGVHDRPGFVTRHGARLFLDGKPYRFTGLNAYELTSWYAVSHGCGSEVKDLDAFFSSLRPNSMVRVTATQQMVVNKYTGQIDFMPIDRVVRAAAEHGQKLVMSLGAQGGTCDDGHWKDRSWYRDGFRKIYDENRVGLRLSYWNWMRAVVSRYRDSPAIGMWQLIGEPEASDCTTATSEGCFNHRECHADAAESLRYFFTVVARELKRLDANHLIGSGSLVRSQCGLAGGSIRSILSIPWIDVANYHDYHSDRNPLPAQEVMVIEAARMEGKPLVVDEVGIEAGFRGGACVSTSRRASLLEAKMRAAFDAGASGVLAWNWEPSSSGSCNYAILKNDPLLSTLRRWLL